MEESHNYKTFFGVSAGALFTLIAVGIIWFLFLGPSTPVGFGWYLFSFASGLTMIVLPCTLPLAFVVVPMSMGKGAVKGLGIAVAFGVGVALTLSMYGVIAAVVGEVAIGTLGAPLETVKNWLYFFAGFAAYLFALGELGFIHVRMPSYTGAAPAFIQKQQDYLKAFFLGLFLGNIGVGCPHPATPVILTRIAASGSVFYGWMLFLVHAIGRILPLLFLAVLGIMGVNALSWLVARKEKVERATGWGMVFVAGFILVLGLFTHDWWVYSGQHTLFEDVTHEEQIIGVIAQKIGVAPPHVHGIPAGIGLFGLPLWLGNWVLVALWVIPFFLYHARKKREEGKAPAYRLPFFIALSALIGLVALWVLPDRFLNHTVHKEMKKEHSSGVMMPHTEEQAVYHDAGLEQEGVSINFNAAPMPVYAGIPTRLDFSLTDKPHNTPVALSTLEPDHGKYLHAIGVRSDLKNFFHVHAESVRFEDYRGLDRTPTIFSTLHTFPDAGAYTIWSEIKKGGTMHIFRHPELMVGGKGGFAKKEISFERSSTVGNYHIDLTYNGPLVKRIESSLQFDIHDLAGHAVMLEPYLDAGLHLVGVSDDLKTFIHTHTGKNMHSDMMSQGFIPKVYAHGMEEMEDLQGMAIPVKFSEAGVYKLFVQFRPRDAGLPDEEALAAEFFVKVSETGLYGPGKWWANLFISLVAIVLLSFGVRKILRV